MDLALAGPYGCTLSDLCHDAATRRQGGILKSNADGYR